MLVVFPNADGPVPNTAPAHLAGFGGIDALECDAGKNLLEKTLQFLTRRFAIQEQPLHADVRQLLAPPPVAQFTKRTIVVDQFVAQKGERRIRIVAQQIDE